MVSIAQYFAVAITACVFLATAARRKHPDNDENVKPGSFDFYVLAQSWQPEFCKGGEYPGCQEPQPYWRTHFTMHGLWPELNSGKHPDSCGGEQFDDQIEQAIGHDTLVEYWPDVKYDESSPQYPQFWEHEWTRHGTCSGLSQVDYFFHAVNLIRNGTVPTPTIVQENVGRYIAANDIRSAYAMNNDANDTTVTLKCNGNALSQVFSCWNKDENNVPTTRFPCPSPILREDTCHSSTLYIGGFA